MFRFNDIQKIEGLSQYAVLKPTQWMQHFDPEAPYIMLCGDYHYEDSSCSNGGCDINKGCYTMRGPSFSLLQELERQAVKLHLMYDVYIESWSALEASGEETESRAKQQVARYAKVPTLSAMQQLIRDLYEKKCLPTQRNTKCSLFPHARVHVVDTRNIDNDRLGADHIVTDFLLALEQRKLDEFMALCQSRYSLVPLSDIITIIAQRLEPAHKVSDEEIYYTYFHSPFFWHYSRTLRELQRLDYELHSHLIEAVLEHPQGRGLDRIQFNFAHKAAFFELLKLGRVPDYTNFNLPKLSTQKVVPYVKDVLIELYTLARVLKPTSPRKWLAIVIEGSAHTYSLYDVLVTNLGMYEVIQKTERYDNDELLDIMILIQKLVSKGRELEEKIEEAPEDEKGKWRKKKERTAQQQMELEKKKNELLKEKRLAMPYYKCQEVQNVNTQKTSDT
jgi:hypothetical protein